MIITFENFITESTSVNIDEAIELIKNKCEENNYEFLGFSDKWHGNATKLILRCNIHDYKWESNFKLVKTDRTACKLCGNERRSKSNMLSDDIGIEKIIKKCEERNYEYRGYIPPWIGKKTKLILFCNTHGEWKTTTYDSFVNSSRGCPKCGNDIRFNALRFEEEKAKNDIINKCQEKGYTFLGFVGDKYINNLTKLIISCPKHGKWDKGNYVSLINKGQGCPICNESKGNERVAKFLILNDLKFVREYTFEDCVSDILTFDKIRSKKLPFDFFLPDYNLCIEYDGEQHFVPKFGNKEDDKRFLMQQENDKIKNEYCTGKNGRPTLLRISYKDYNNIEEILEHFTKKAS